MDYANIMAKLGTIDEVAMDLAQLRRDIEGLQLMVVEMKLAQENADGSETRQLDLVDSQSEAWTQDEMQARIENMVCERIVGWQYAQQIDGATWWCPITPSRIAEGIGRPDLHRQVKQLMWSAQWDRLSFFRAAPPAQWQASGTNTKVTTWVSARFPS